MPYIIQAVGLCKGINDSKVFPFESYTTIGTFPCGEFNCVNDFTQFCYRELNMKKIVGDLENTYVSYWDPVKNSWIYAGYYREFQLANAKRNSTIWYCIYSNIEGVALQVMKA